jgi:hypothetical protein
VNGRTWGAAAAVIALTLVLGLALRGRAHSAVAPTVAAADQPAYAPDATIRI